MLYLSRIFDNELASTVRYGIVDTDDDSEQLISWPALRDNVVGRGLEIAGVSTSDSISGLYIHDTHPYQDARYCTAAQAKAKTLLGVELVLWRGIITCITADANVTPTGATLCLSDYCTKVNASAYIGWLPSTNKSKFMRLILDDKITELSISSQHVFGVVWDISELNNPAVLNVLRDKLSFLASQESWEKYVIDRQKRRF